MKVEVKKIDKIKRTLKIDIIGDEFLQERDKFYLEAGKDLKVPGFRPGKIPLDVLIKHHDEFLKSEFLKNKIPYFYSQALDQEKLEPVNHPNIYDVDLSQDHLSFFADFEIKPDMELNDKDYKDITIDDKNIQVEEIEIEKYITGYKEEIKKYVSLDLDDKALANWAGYPTIAGLREAIKAQIFMDKLNNRRQVIVDTVTKHLIDNIKVEPPVSVVERQHKYLVEREMYNLKMRGIAQEDIEKYKKDIEDKLQNVASNRVKLAYILDAIAKKENIKGNDEELPEIVLGYILSKCKYIV